MIVNSKLCSFCQVVISTTELDQKAPFHPSSGSLKSSANGGCPLCAILWDFYADHKELSNLKLHEINDKLSYAFQLVRRSDRDDYMYQFWVTLPDELLSDETPLEDLEMLSIKNALIMPISGQQRNQRVIYRASSGTDSEESWETGANWLRQCSSCHSKCGGQIESQLPTRILDVGSSQSPSLRLCINTLGAIAAPYLTLSHCWGQLDIKRLLQDNLSDFAQHIEWNELPKTFQDAIFITRMLGVRYLWIDSLCIIQDSLVDWECESGNMANIYSNAFCNIAATAAKDARDGCLFNRNPHLSQVCRLQIHSLPCSVQPSEDNNLYDLILQSFWIENILDAPLGDRAWVLQEHFLSPRIIHCGKSQLLWECQELAACEMYPEGVPNASVLEFYALDFKWSADSKLLQSWNNRSPLPHEERLAAREFGLRTWKDCLRTYTARSLTEERDKLVAISGASKRIQQLIQCDYLAGLWTCDFAPQLLWKRGYQIPLPDPPTMYRAPSWSWASVNCDIYYDSSFSRSQLDETLLIQVIEVKLGLATADAYGQITGGHMLLKGWRRGFPLEISRTNDRTWMFKIGGEIAAFVNADSLHEAKSHKWICVPVVASTPKIPIEGQGGRVEGLVLTETGEPGVYRRVGTFTSNDKGYGKIYPRGYFDVFNRPVYPKPTTDFKTTLLPYAISQETLSCEGMSLGEVYSSGTRDLGPEAADSPKMRNLGPRSAKIPAEWPIYQVDAENDEWVESVMKII